MPQLAPTDLGHSADEQHQWVPNKPAKLERLEKNKKTTSSIDPTRSFQTSINHDINHWDRVRQLD